MRELNEHFHCQKTVFAVKQMPKMMQTSTQLTLVAKEVPLPGDGGQMTVRAVHLRLPGGLPIDFLLVKCC